MFSTPGPGRRQPADQPERRLRHAEEFCAGRDRVAEPAVAGGPPFGAGQDGEGARGLRQGQPRQGPLPLPGLRHAAASGRRDVQVDDRPRHRACALSRFRARDHRSAGRTDADLFRQLRQRAPARRGREAARDRGHRRRRAARNCRTSPPCDESGYGGIEATYWNGLLAPAGTPAAVVARLNAAVNQALAVPEVRAALQKLGSDPKTRNSAGIRRLHRGRSPSAGARSCATPTSRSIERPAAQGRYGHRHGRRF